MLRLLKLVCVVGWCIGGLSYMHCTPRTVSSYASWAMTHPQSPARENERCLTNTKALGYMNVNYGGFVNQLRLLSHAITIACAARQSLILDVWTTNFYHNDSRMVYFGGSDRLPLFKSDLLTVDHVQTWSSVIDYGGLNRVLQSMPECGRTRVESQGCARVAQRTGRLACPLQAYLFDQPRSELLLPRIPLVRSQCAAPAPYHAIHFNLDVDWIIVGNRGISNSDYWEYLKMSKTRRRAFERECCSERGFYADYARRVADELAAKTRRLPPGPVFVATSIGKPGHHVLAWLLRRFSSSIGDRRVLTCPLVSTKPMREVEAARELSFMDGASTLLMHMNSTYSVLACKRIQARGGRCYRGYGRQCPELPVQNVAEI